MSIILNVIDSVDKYVEEGYEDLNICSMFEIFEDQRNFEKALTFLTLTETGDKSEDSIKFWVSEQTLKNVINMLY